MIQSSTSTLSKHQLVGQSPNNVRLGLYRWTIVLIAVLSNVLKFLGRQVLSSAGPALKTDFHISNTQYGFVISAFSLVYAATTPFAGLFIDRVGLRVGAF